jgi:phosphate transport system permease protein
VFVVQPAVMPWMRRKAQVMGRAGMACLYLIKFIAICVFTLGFTLLVAAILNRLGLDPRQDWIFLYTDFSPMDVYVQRNALIVGFVMGFAVIPIIYTIADDALASVPEHLRSASLGCGATPWQTATRIVIPSAMSGLFSALMIGLGRAVGETMIVLMALGNTAIMDLNVFNGARTLSANIAVELPEAVRNSGHYRTLFLAALVLFGMTFVVNTLAEMVRLRFRRRSYQL